MDIICASDDVDQNQSSTIDPCGHSGLSMLAGMDLNY